VTAGCRDGCGACCSPFVTIVPPVALQDGTAERMYADDPGMVDWMREHLTPIRRKDGLAMVPWMPGGGWSNVPAAFDDVGRVVMWEPVLMPSHFYRCDLFDEGTRRCTDYDNRPSVCRDYPWYGSAPDPSKSLPSSCSYRADIGLPVGDVPVTITRSVP
jgi:Fe-S-cluster containining protein